MGSQLSGGVSFNLSMPWHCSEQWEKTKQGLCQNILQSSEVDGIQATSHQESKSMSLEVSYR